MAPHEPKPGYTLRPGLASDLPAVTRLYRAAFDGDAMLDILFPGRRARPHQLHAYLLRFFQWRWWTPGWSLRVLVDDVLGVPVGFAWWRRPVEELGWAERWLTPYAWLAPLMRLYVSLKSLLRPSPFHHSTTGIFTRAFATVEPQLFGTARRRQAWYLSIVAVLPSLHGQGLGGVLLRDGLRGVDARGAASYLISLRGVEPFYQRYGFVEVARANVGKLKEWDGGAIMFRE